MTLTFELWHLVLGSLSMAGMFMGLWKLLLVQTERRIDAHLESIREETDRTAKLQAEVTALRIELPERYLRREDYVRGQTVIESKLDAIANELKIVQIKGAGREH